jgi:TRAP-type transport system small permease protein
MKALPGARVARTLESASGALLLVMMLVVLVDVVLRNLFNRPLPWGTEVLEVVLAAMVFLLYPTLARQGGHITVDLIPVPKALQRLQTVVSDLLGGLLFGLIAVCLLRQARRAADFGEGTPLLQIPHAWTLGVMAALAAVAVLGFLISAVWRPRAGEAASEHPPAQETV